MAIGFWGLSEPLRNEVQKLIRFQAQTPCCYSDWPHWRELRFHRGIAGVQVQPPGQRSGDGEGRQNAANKKATKLTTGNDFLK